MTKSMTAFARSESGHISWEIRSVNHRYLEVGVKVPDAFRSLEIGLRNKLKARLNRGKIDCQLRIGHSQASEASLSIDEKLLEDLTGALATIIPKLETVAPVNPLEVLKWPGLLRSIVGQAATEAPIISARQRDKMISKLNDLKIEADPGRIEQELVIMAQKSDVAEELDRLNTHIEEVSATLGSKEAVGRRLDFLMQELNREANTLSSKAVATNTTIQAVELKVAIEQMREQIQNIE